MKTQAAKHTEKVPKVMECVCSHEWQDKRYGKSQRLMNPMKEGKYRCSVCHREH